MTDRHRARILLPFLAGVCVLVGLLASLRLRAARENAPPPPPPPTVIFTNDTMGFLQVSCGCKGYGGVVERGKLIRRMRAEGRPPLLADAGNSLFGSTESIQNEGKNIVDVLNILGYSVYNVSYRDFRLGRAVLRARMEGAAFPFVSANIVDAVTGELWVKPWVVVTTRGVRLGFLGITRQPRFLDQRPDLQEQLKGVRVEDPFAAVAKHLPALQPECDVVIVLSYMTHEDNLEMVRRNAGIAIVLEGGNAPMEGFYRSEEGSAFASSADKGVHVGEIQFHQPAAGAIVPRAFFHDTRENASGSPDQQQHLSRAHACEACHLRDGKWSLEPYFTMQQMKGGMVGDCKQCH